MLGHQLPFQDASLYFKVTDYLSQKGRPIEDLDEVAIRFASSNDK
jgi:hypothetical protein